MNSTAKQTWQRLTEPAPVIHKDRTKIWYKDGELHRDNDKPAVVWSDGNDESGA